jgi:hypothetical protein
MNASNSWPFEDLSNAHVLRRRRRKWGARITSIGNHMLRRTATLILIACLGLSVHADPRPSLAYDEGFVWYLSGRLAADLVRFQSTARARPQPEGEAAAQRADLELLYHRSLVDCKGPLPELAKVLRVIELKDSVEPTFYLSIVGGMESEIWPIVQRWNSTIMIALVDTYAKGAYGVFPDCVLEEFRIQNPLLAIPSTK